MKRIFSFLLAVAMVLSFSLVTTTPVAAATINVPGDYSTIQAAINAANPGDTIQVAAGTYHEQVVINKNLTLQGAGDATIIKPWADNLTQVFTGLLWYGGTRRIAGIIVANVPGGSSVTIKNLKVDESLVTTKPAGADYLAGIFYRETGGLVDTVTVAGTGAWSSSDRAYGIYLSAGTNTVSVEITGSTITNFDKNGIEVMGVKLTADINHNRITGRASITDEVQNGVNIGRDAVATVNYNTISNIIYQPATLPGAGILFYHYVLPAGVSATANGNNITDCQTGIIFDNANGSAEGNIVDGGTVGLVGISAQPDAEGEWTASIVDNTVSGIRDMSNYDNAAIGVNTYVSGVTLNVTIEDNHLPGGGSTDADGISIGVGGADGTIVATITDNTISGWKYGIRLDGALVDAANSCANHNNISGNDVFGVYNGGTGTLNAICNWWGAASGPYHPTANPVGTGDDVSDNVIFTPWRTETETATGVNASASTTNASATATGGTPDTTVTVTEYSGNPGGSPPIGFTALGKYIDVYVPNTDQVTELEIKLYYTAAELAAADIDGEELLQLFWWDGTVWRQCSDRGVNTTNRYIWAKIRTDTTPNLTQLTGTPFGGMGKVTPTVTTQAATNITSYSAIVNMSYTVGNFSPVELRFACKISIDQAWFYTDWMSRTQDGNYTVVLTGLALQTEYEFKSQLKYDSTLIEGGTCRFTTAPGPSFIDLFCFIATAAYGTPTAEQIDVLREFRDLVLVKSTVGSQFVTLYYRLSPPIADFIARSDLLRALVREFLVDPVVWIVEATGDIWRN
jgi:hypothetical protein